jgi:hypothetical protein
MPNYIKSHKLFESAAGECCPVVAANRSMYAIASAPRMNKLRLTRSVTGTEWSGEQFGKTLVHLAAFGIGVAAAYAVRSLLRRHDGLFPGVK